MSYKQDLAAKMCKNYHNRITYWMAPRVIAKSERLDQSLEFILNQIKENVIGLCYWARQQQN